MTWWKRIFGLDPIDLAVHVTVTGLVAGMFDTVVGFGDETAVMAVFAAGTVAYAWRRQRALRALPPPAPREEELARLEDLELRVAELEEAHARVLELEERLDFTERMLARGPDPVSVARPGEEAR